VQDGWLLLAEDTCLHVHHQLDSAMAILTSNDHKNPNHIPRKISVHTRDVANESHTLATESYTHPWTQFLEMDQDDDTDPSLNLSTIRAMGEITEGASEQAISIQLSVHLEDLHISVKILEEGGGGKGPGQEGMLQELEAEVLMLARQKEHLVRQSHHDRCYIVKVCIWDL